MKVAIHRQGLGHDLPTGYGGLEVWQDEVARNLVGLGVPMTDDWREASIIHLFGVYDQTPDRITEFKAAGKTVVLSTVYWFWGGLPFTPDQVVHQRRIIDASFSEADILLPCCAYEARTIRLRHGVPMAKMRTVVCGVAKNIRQQAGAYDFDEEDLRGLIGYILVIGRFEVRKNQATLLRALQDDPTPILFIGDVNDQGYFEQCLGLAANRPTVTEFYAGMPQGAVWNFMARAGMLVQPSIHENVGMVILEGAALGIPITPTDHPTVREYLGERVAYLPPRSEAGIREAIDANRGQPGETWQSLQALVLEKYTWAKSAEQTLHVYEELEKERRDHHAS